MMNIIHEVWPTSDVAFGPGELPQYAETMSLAIRDQATVGAAEQGVCSNAVVRVPTAAGRQQ
jgi:hypothetical protein